MANLLLLFFFWNSLTMGRTSGRDKPVDKVPLICVAARGNQALVKTAQKEKKKPRLFFLQLLLALKRVFTINTKNPIRD